MNKVVSDSNNDKSLFKGRLHFIDGKHLFASNYNKLFRSTDAGNSWELFISLPVSKIHEVIGFYNSIQRLLRLGIHHIVKWDENTFSIMAFGKIYLYNHLDDTLLSSPLCINGSRPLSLCMDDSGWLYFGEYWSNSERRPVYVHASLDGGLSWETIWEYNGIRHIHGVYFDPYSKSIWITTGDENDESAIWVTEDKFNTVVKVVGGNQRYRTVQLLFTEKYVYYGSDIPNGQNFLYRFDKKTCEVDVLQYVEGSVFWGCSVGKRLFFSTVVEPSLVNKNNRSNVWGSDDGETWKLVISFKKDILPMKLFQYGQILFPTGENSTEHLFFTPLCTRLHNSVMRVSVSDIFESNE